MLSLLYIFSINVLFDYNISLLRFYVFFILVQSISIFSLIIFFIIRFTSGNHSLREAFYLTRTVYQLCDSFGAWEADSADNKYPTSWLVKSYLLEWKHSLESDSPNNDPRLASVTHHKNKLREGKLHRTLSPSSPDRNDLIIVIQSPLLLSCMSCEH